MPHFQFKTCDNMPYTNLFIAVLNLISCTYIADSMIYIGFPLWKSSVGMLVLCKRK